MIIEYHRPKTLDEVLQLIAREEPVTLPMGGGTILNQPSDEDFAVVDLQALGLHEIRKEGHSLLIGATAKLQKILDQPDLQEGLKKSLRHEATYNLRQMRTIAGSIVAGDGRSPLVTSLLALDAQLSIAPNDEGVSLGNLLPVRSEELVHRVIVSISVPLNARISYHYVARSPADLPIVCASAVQWPSGRTRLALGGYGRTPVLAMDGQGMEGAEEAAQNSYEQAGDQWASADYRREIAGVLARRCVEELAAGK